jgi:gliding motility-associated-like protein
MFSKTNPINLAIARLLILASAKVNSQNLIKICVDSLSFLDANIKSISQNRAYLSDSVSGNLMPSTKSNSFAKKLALQVALILFTLSSQAQITNLRFTNEAATYVPITGGTNLVAAASAVGAPSAVTNIGFTFNFQGVNYTQFSVNAAGLLKLGSVAVTNENNNLPLSVTNTPKIYALWDAFFTGNSASTGGVTSLLTGSAPNRVLTVQWRVGLSSNVATTTNFQVLLYETSNKIEFLYGAAPALTSASVGLGGIDAANDYLSAWTPNGVVSTSGFFTTNTVIPGAGTGMKYTFTPTAPLTISPACLTDQPNLWLKADEGVNYTRTLLNVPAASRTATSSLNTTSTAALSVLNSATSWNPSAAEGSNSTPAGSTPIGAITLDLGSVQSIDGIATLGDAASAKFVFDYIVRVSNDNVTWTTLGMFHGNEVASELHYADFDAPVSCRYVRVVPGAFSTNRAMRLDVYTKTLTPLPANNTKVSVWEDLSGNNWNASQPTSVAKQPTFLTNHINFNPALNFAATSVLDIPDYDVARRYSVRSTTLGGIPELVVLSTPFIHTGVTGPQVIAESISYPVAPTATQQNVAQSYLATKYGITLTSDYLAGDGTTKIFDLTANAGYTKNIFGIGRSDCQGLHQRQSKSVNADGLMTIGNNNIINWTDGNTAISGNNISTNNSYLMLGDNGGSINFNTSVTKDNRIFLSRIWELQETGSIGSVKISVPGFGNTATSTLPNLAAGYALPTAPTLYLVADNDGNFTNGGTTYYPMTAVGSGATLRYEANADLTSAAPYISFAIGDLADSDADGVNDFFDIDADNDGIVNAVESPACYYTAEEMASLEAISTELGPYSTYVASAAIDNSATSKAALGTGQNWVGKEIYKVTARGYTAITSMTLVLDSWALSGTGGSTFKLQGSIDGGIWTDLAAPLVSTATSGNLVINNTLSPSTKFKYFRLFGVAGTSSYCGISNISLNIPSFIPSAFPKETCTATDTDADGIFNHLDLDSDGDGCPDALESGVTGTLSTGTVVNLTTGSTTATTSTPSVANAIAAGPYNANGFADGLQTTGNGVYTGLYSYNYAINNKYNLCADIDGDGIKDIIDLDDDNDGILDHIESPSCFVSKAAIFKPIAISSELPQYSTNLIGYAIDNDPTSKSAFLQNQDWVGKEIFKLTAATNMLVSGVSFDMNSWAFTANGSHTFRLQGSSDNYIWSNLSAPMSSQETTGTVTINNTLLPNAKFKYLRIVGVVGMSSYIGVTDLRINIPVGFNSSAYPKETCTEDKDADVKLNHQDLDSDADGCFDAVEAGVLPRTTTTGIVDGAAFGLNGFADALETAAESGTFKNTYYYDYAVNTALVNCTDTDGDGILNVVDIDDDNDGTLDADEAPSCYMSTFQSWNTANKTPYVTITSEMTLQSPNTNLAALTDNNMATAAVKFLSTPAQSQYQKELYRATFVQPVQLDAIYIKKSSATQVVGAGLMVQGSNDPNNGNWINLLPAVIASPADATNVTVNGSVSLANSNKFTLTANPGKYKYYRIYGTTDVDVPDGIATEFYFDVNRAAYVPSIFGNATCTTDTDTDGIINTLDLDSDGDGCSDAVEASANRSATSTTVYPTGTDVNANGLLDSYEATPAGTINYFSTYINYALVKTIDSCLDTDLDGIPDSLDIDDDNDGVLDADEQKDCTYPQKDLTTLTFNGNGTGTFTASTLTMSGTSSWKNSYSDQKLKLPIHLEWNTSVTGIGMLGLLPVGSAKSTSNYTDEAYKVYHNATNIYGWSPPIPNWSFTGTYVANDLIEMDINTAGVVTIRQNGWVVRSFKGKKSDYNLVFSSHSAKVLSNIKLTSYAPIEMVCTDIDTDGDGTVDRLDIDSDGDGCNDAVEAGAALPTVAIPFVGAVGTNGLIDSKEETVDSGDITYMSTYSSYAVNREFNACSDTDVDGIGDLTDIDDDNDGLTDEIEQGCSSPLFVNKTSTFTSTTKTGLMTGTVLKETGNIDYELKMTGPSLAFTPANYESGSGLHFQVGDGGKLNINLNLKLTSTAFEASPVASAPKVRYVEFGPNVPLNTVPSNPINEAQNITLNWPGAYGIVYDPFNQLSSHNTGDIIENGDLITQDVNITAADVNAKKTWKVRMYMHNTTDLYEVNANIFGDPTIAVQSYGFNLSACSSFDSDTDGIINELDKDSDGDGCSDAFEGGTTTNSTPNFTFANSTVGTNGLTSSLEVSDDLSTAVNYTSTYNLALSTVLNKCLDTDGDNVNNGDDIDDDNDGILDAEEMGCGFADFTMANLTTSPAATGNLQNLNGRMFKGMAYAEYEINLVGVSTVLTSPGTAETSFDNSKGGLHYFFKDNDNVYSQTFRILPSDPSSLNKVQFGVNLPVNQLNSPTSNVNNAQSIALTWSPDVKGIVFDPNDQLSSHATGDVILPGAVIITRADYTTALSTWKIEFMTKGSSEQFFLQTSHKATSATDFSFESYAINAELCFADDTDGDRIADYLDLDSDGDGCGDAFESGASATPGGANQTVAGPYGANGFADSIENNDTASALIKYTTTAYMAYSPVSACADSDGDTLPDRDDIDDDNDGILDSDEYSCEVGSFVKSYVIGTGLGMSYGGSFSTSSSSASVTSKFNDLTGLTSVTDVTNGASFLVNDSNGAYTMKSTIAPTNGILSQIEFGPNLAGNTANAAVSNAQQSITLNWSLPIGAAVYDPDDQLSSHATGDAVNPGGVLVTRSAYTVGQQTWKIVIPLPYYTREVEFTANFSTSGSFGTESFGIGINVCRKATDIDNDKKMNAVDTDADGDGCFDLVEAKSKQNTTLTQEIIGGTYGPNGLSSLVETNDTKQSGVNYTVIKDFLNNKIKGCTDTDGDNVPNIDDIDDDNDGILDQTECPTEPGVTAFTFVRINNNQFFIRDKGTGQNLAKATVARIKNMSVESLSFNVNDFSVHGHWADAASTNNVDRQMYLKFEPVAPFTAMKLSVLASEGGNGGWWFHPRKWKVDGGIAGDGVIKSIPQRYYLKEPYSVGDVITPDMWMSTAFKGALGPDANKVFIQVQYSAVATVAKPLIITYTWNTISGTVANENFGFQMLDMSPSSGDGSCDYDKDGINDDLDSDSDNDGCPDTKEAVHGKAYSQSSSNYIKGPYGANGFSTLMETNDTFGATYSNTSWLPKVTTSPKKDYVNEEINTRCIIPFIKAAGPTEFCAEGSVVLSIDLNKGATPTGYQWLKDGVAIPTATSASFTATESGEYTCTLTYADSSTVTTDIQDVIENPLPSAPVVTGYTGPVCLGADLTLTSSYTTGNQWYYNNSPISGATNQTYKITNSGDYKVEYTDPLSGCKNSSTTTVVVISNVPITPTVSIVQTTCSSNKGSITVNPTGVGTDLYSIDGINYQVSNVFTDVLAGTYSVRVKNSSGCISGAASAVINVQPVSPATPTITNTGTAICAGGATVLTSSESTGNQWFVGGVLIPGATNPTFTASAAGNYTVEVTNTAGCSTMSAVTTITVSPTPTASISQSIELASSNCGTSAPVKLTASTDVPAGASYVWYKNGAEISLATNSTYTAVESGSYTVKVTNASGCSFTSAASVVSTGPSVFVSSGIICLGETFTFSASTSGFTSPTFAWEFSADGINGWATPSSGKSDDINFAATTAGYYRVVVSETGKTTITSCPTELKVNALPVVSVTNSLESSTPAICAGQTLVLTAVGTGISTYQWYNGSTSILGATSPTFTASLGGSYSVLVTNSNGCQATSAPVTVTVNALPDAPASTVVQPTCTTATGTITVTAPLGTAFTYSINGGTFQTSPVFSGLAAGTYTLIAKDALGCVGTSSTQTVNAAPVALILTGTIDGKATPFLAETISYSIPPVTGAISYQWTLPSAWSGTSSTNTILATTAAMTNNTGVVTVRAVNEFGCLSEPLTLNVAIKPAKPTVIDLSYCQNATASALTATAATGGTLNWYAAATGGTMSATAPTPLTTVAGLTSYYVSQTVSGVESDRAELVVTINPAPAALGAISGETIVLASSSQTYSVSPVSGASTYVWTLPSGYTGSSTTNTINVTVGTSPGTISVLAKSDLNCENIPQTLAILIKPAAPVTAPVSYCQNVTASALTATATGTLNWYDSLTSTTKLIAAPTPDTQVAAVTRYYVTQTVNGVESDRAELSVTVKLVPAKPGSITGETTAIPGETEVYSVQAVANATSYTWTLPNGWSGSSNTNTISVVVGSTSGTISVVANANSCSSEATTLAVGLFVFPDTDGDGVTDAQEAIDGTDPNDPCKFNLASQTQEPSTAWKAADCDGDGVSNEKEKIDGTDPLDPCDFKIVSQTLPQSAAWNSADCDGDGVTNGKEITDGTDPLDSCSFKLASQTLATSTAWNNADCDEDGLTNKEEKTGIDDPSTPANPNNKITDPSKKDSDGDGVTDEQEAIDGTDPNDPCSFKLASQTEATSTAWNNADCDEDGLTNKEEKTGIDDPSTPANPNGKITDPSNKDSDGDGVTDAQEAIDGTDPNDPCSFKLASQTVATSTAWNNADCDADGLTNKEEKTGIDDPSTPANPAGKITDPSKKDSDGDGVTDAQEAIDGTDPNDPCSFKLVSQTEEASAAWKNADCDKDGLTNQEEKTGIDDPSTPANPSGKITDPSKKDSDGDGVTDAQEAIDGTDPNDPCSFKLSSQTEATSTAWNNADCDGDGLTNQEEKTGIDDPSTPANPNGKITDPLKKDSDGDGVTDAQEAIDGTDPNDPCSFKLASQTEAASAAWNNADCDGDGVTNAQEKTDGTDPNDPCSFKLASQTLTPSTAWNNADCDGDGVTNAKEKIDGTDPNDPCSFVLASQTTFGNAAWKNADCDGDGVSNGKEVTDGTDPSDPCSFVFTSQTLPTSAAWNNADCDGDGVTNGKEVIDGTDPTSLCSFKLASQTVATSTAWNNADCDGDGLTNQEEKTGIDDPSTPANPNGKITDPSNKDTDGDGVTDAQEAIDGTDPNNPCSLKLSSQTLPTSAAWLSADCDGDGLTNEEEKTGIDNPATPVNPNGKITNPLEVDTDGDGVSDSKEAIDGTDPNDPCSFKLASQTLATSTAWNNADCDGDGLTNKEEKTGIDDPSTPANPNGKITDPLIKDTDGDGVTDAQEAIDGTDPNDPCSFKLASQTLTPSDAWKSADCDGDGESNSLEKENGTDPLNKCSNSIPFPTPTITSSGSEVCAGTLVKLTSSEASGYQWFKDGTAINGATSRDLDTYESGSYTVKVLNSLGCTSVSSLANVVVVTAPLTVNIAEGAVLAMNGSCNSTPIKLTVSANATGVSYQWSKDGVDIDGATAATYDASGPGLYKVRVSKGGCTTESAGTRILPAADASTSLSPIVCAGEKVELSVSTTGYTSSATYQWRKNGVDIPSANQPIYNAEASGIYTVAVTDGATTVSCPLTITVNVPPVVSVSAPAATICAGEESTLTASATGTAPFTYKWRVNGIEMNTETAAIFKTKVSGTFDVKVTDANGCEVISAQTVVTVNALPAAVVASAISQPTCNISTGTIKVSIPAVTTGMTYSINGIDYTNTTGLFENVASGTYTVTAKNANGCVSASATVQINAQPLTPAQPGVISGSINVLPNKEYTYTISPVTGATSYTWTLPNGWVGTSTTTSITAKASTIGGTISVVANAGACISPASTLLVIFDVTTDTDGDGVVDSKEILDGTDPSDPCEYAKSSITVTTSSAWDGLDCDGDGVTNGQEVIDGTDSNDPCSFKLASQTLAPSAAWNNADCDGDGVTNGKEKSDGTDPSDPCSFKLASQTLTPSAAWNDADCDGDGVTNAKEKSDGTDPNNICSFILISQTLPSSTAWKVADCDEDGLTNEEEKTGIDNPLTPANPNGKITDPLIKDTDGDGVTDAQEAIDGTDPNDPCSFKLASQTLTPSNAWKSADCDGDGLTNQEEKTGIDDPSTPVNPNGKITDPLDKDTDGDGVTDAQEAIDGTDPNDPCSFKLASQTEVTSTAWNNGDCDGDGLTNKEEKTGIDDPSTPANPNGKITDPSNKDTDGDGVTDAQEAIDGTDPNDPCSFKLASQTLTPSAAWKSADCDGDGLTNQEEKTGIDDPSTPANPNGKITDPLDKDTDGDGVTDAQEAIDGTDPNDPCSFKLVSQTEVTSTAWNNGDCDGDGLTNKEEKTGIDDPSTPANPNGKITDPSNKDTDGDGVTDAQEAIDGTDPNDPCSFKLASQTLTPSNAWKSADCDGDGLTNQEEKTGIDDPSTPANPNGKITDPSNKDTDGDGVTDAQEAIDGTDPNDPCSFKLASQTVATSTAWNNADCDADGLTNKEEKTGIDDPSTPANPNGKITDPSNKDTDGDGVTDAQEAIDGTNPNDPCSFKLASQTLTPSNAWKSADCDGDGLTNQEEKTGIDDPSTPANPNGKITDPSNKDTDGDGVTDAQEAIDGTDPNDPCSFKLASQTVATSTAWNSADCDGDGLTNKEEKTGIDDPSTPANPNGKITDPLEKDTDGDGVTDAQEAIDGTNPNDPCSFKLASQTVATSTAWNNADCDGDGVSNGQEKSDGTNPSDPCSFKLASQTMPTSSGWNNADCDGDGVTNGKEKADGTNPNDACSFKIASQTLTPNTAWNNADCDGDGVTNAKEKTDGTDPNDICSFKLASQTMPTSTAWNNADCDGDGLTNQEEKTGIDNPSTPANPAGKITDPMNKDTDGDGVSDAQEAIDGTNPNDACSFKLASQTLTPSAAWNNGDCDGDGVSNGKEKSDGTNPLDPCSLKVSSISLPQSDAWKNGDCDGDGLKNEVDGIEDCDKDGTPNFMDPDACKIDIVMANVFTPNGDGINDEIKPVLMGIDKFVCFKVYNRWGNLIFESKDREKGWDGSFRTEGQGTETFQWLAEGYDRDGKLIKRTGMITLLR